MNTSEANRKVAISRWKKVEEQECKRIRKDKEALLLKSLLCGFICGDGSVQERKEKTHTKYQLNFFADDEKMIEDYIDAMSAIYGKIPTIKHEKNMISARLSSRTVVKDLKNTGKFGIKTWFPTENLFEIEGAKEAWLRGFFSAEGYVNDKVIRIQTVNEIGMSKVSKLLHEIGIENKEYSYVPKNDMHSKVWIIIITKKEARLKFYEKVGFSHNKKTAILKKALGL